MGRMAADDTRERVLLRASELFARQGYSATTTRAIADAVGVRQPSLFYHFKSKAEVMSELLSHSLTAPAAVATALADADGSPASRLYAYLRYDLQHVLNSPYDLGGLDSDEVLGLDEFAPWRAMQELLRDARRKMIQQGIAAREFVDLPVDLAHDAITGLILGLIRGHARDSSAATMEVAEQAADLALRALLADTRRLDIVKNDLTPLPIIR